MKWSKNQLLIFVIKYIITHKTFAMVITTQRSNWWKLLSLALVIPTLFFITISILKYELGIPLPFDTVTPWLDRMGIKEAFGWNINLLILFGPVIAAGISLWQVLHLESQFSREQFQFNVTVQKKGFPLFILFLAGLIVAFLFIYMIGENCNC